MDYSQKRKITGTCLLLVILGGLAALLFLLADAGSFSIRLDLSSRRLVLVVPLAAAVLLFLVILVRLDRDPAWFERQVDGLQRILVEREHLPLLLAVLVVLSLALAGWLAAIQAMLQNTGFSERAFREAYPVYIFLLKWSRPGLPGCC